MDGQNKKRSIMDEISTKPVRSAGQKRQAKMILITLASIAVIGGAAYFFLIPREKTYTLTDYETAVVTKGDMVRTTQASGTVAIPVQMTVTAPDAGGESAFAEALYVQEGDAVTKGQLLAKLSVPALITELTDLETDLAEAEDSLAQLITQNKFTLQKAEREIERLRTDRKDQAAEVEKQKQLVAINASRKSDLDTAEKALAKLDTDITEKTISLGESRELGKLNEEAKKASIARTKTRIARLRDDIAKADVKSPMNGEVLKIEAKLSVPGSVVATGSTLFTIADRTSAIIELEVPEQYSGLLSTGRQVALSVGGTALGGTISAIGKIATASSDGLSSTVTVKVIPQAGADLLLGSSVVSELQLGTSSGVLTLPRGPYLTTGGQKYVYVVSGNRAYKTKVTFGELQSSTVQVQDGLQEGDTVVTSGYQNFIDYETITLGGNR